MTVKSLPPGPDAIAKRAVPMGSYSQSLFHYPLLMMLKYGDVYCIKSLIRDEIFVMNRDIAQDILVNHSDKFSKQTYLTKRAQLLFEPESVFFSDNISNSCPHRRIISSWSDKANKSNQGSGEDEILNRSLPIINDFIDSLGEKKYVMQHRFGMLSADILFQGLFDYTYPGNLKPVWRRLQFLSRFSFTNPIPLWVPIAANGWAKYSHKFYTRIIYDAMDNFLSTEDSANNLLSDFMGLISDDVDIEEDSERVMEQLRSVFSIGQLTMTSVLSWTFYFLSQHPDKLNILRHEIDGLFQGDDLNEALLGDIAEYKYTKAVLQEVMRLFPSFFWLPRKPIDDIELGDFLFPKSHTVYVHLYGMHRNTKYWAQADKFIPERFLTGSGYRVVPGSYLPFGAGSRACPFKSYIMKQMMLVVIGVVKRYDFKDKTLRHVEPYPSWTLVPHPKIKLKFCLRENS